MKCMCPTCKSADYENKTILMVHWIQAQLAFSVHEERTNWSRKTGQLEDASALCKNNLPKKHCLNLI